MFDSDDGEHASAASSAAVEMDAMSRKIVANHDNLRRSVGESNRRVKGTVGIRVASSASGVGCLAP